MKTKALLLPLFLLQSIALIGQTVCYDVCELKCENLVNPLGIDNMRPHFSWKLTSLAENQSQSAYEIEVACDSAKLAKGKADVWKSGRVESRRQVMVDYTGSALQPRSYYYWRVKSYDKDGNPSPWSDIAHFSIGVVDDRLNGSYVMAPVSMGDRESVVVWRNIRMKKYGKVLIHINSLGYHELYVNGRRISDTVLAPAVSQLDKRSAIVTYDMTDALRKGDNAIAICLGQGWYKKNTFNAQYDGPVVKAEIDEISGKTPRIVCFTDSTWNACSTGYSGIGTWFPLQFGGERLDGAANVFTSERTITDLTPLAGCRAEEVTLADMKASPQMFGGNRIARRLRPIYGKSTSEGWVLDLGRNINGWFSMDFSGLRNGQEVKIEYTDDLTDGKFVPQGEHDIYVASGKATERFTNRFHSHAYRYARVSGLDYEPSCDDVSGIQITGTNDSSTDFSCSDADINAIHDMVQYTLRCLTFSGYSVDSPHLERMGYGGDGNSSTMPIQTMFDAADTYYNWIQAWADVQDSDGGMPYVAPAGGGGGGPYWCGFIVQAPYRAYLNYADDRMLEKHYAIMQRWMDYVKRYSPDGLLQRWPDTKNRMWFLGDWLTPNNVDAGDERSVSLVSNCFLLECLQSMTDIAKHLGKESDARQYSAWRDNLKSLLHTRYYNPSDSTYASGSPLDMAYAMNSGIVPDDTYDKVKTKLVGLQRGKYRSHIAVGLVGVAIFTEWAVRNHEAELMYDILKQPDYPGYMDMINHDATTTWESWDRSRSRIHNCYNGIGTWFYQALGGITPDPERPGYEHFTVDPQPVDAIEWVDVKKETPYGQIKVHWKKTDGYLQLDLTVPVGTSATVKTPQGNREVGSGQHSFML